MHRTAMPARVISLSGVGLAGLLALSACSGSSSGGGNGSAAPGGSKGHVTVTLTAANGCALSTTTFPAGPVTFDVTNQDATDLNEVELLSGDRIVGEKENLPPGFSGTFSVNVDGGDYTFLCPGAAKDRIPVTATGTAPTSGGGSVEALLKQGTKDYASYVTAQARYLVAATKDLQSAIAGGNLADAQAAYAKARPFYEKIEPVAESFTIGRNSLDADLDAREGDVPAAKWQGFHPIEKALFQAKTTDGLSTLAAGLVKNTQKLQRLTTGLTYQPYELANGAQGLLDEVASSKITGEEERYSRIDLLDFANNDEGAEQAFSALEPGLSKIDPQLTRTIVARFAALDALVDSYRTGANPSGFVYYDVLTKADKRKLAAAVKAVQEPLSQVASKVAKV